MKTGFKSFMFIIIGVDLFSLMQKSLYDCKSTIQIQILDMYFLCTCMSVDTGLHSVSRYQPPALSTGGS